jgi:protein-tyrosine phosphatase
MKILMVCLGNICRSPLAEGILRSKLEVHMDGLHIDSAGTGGWHAGEPPDRRSVTVAQQNGLDISKQRARKLIKEDLENFDVIFAMDRSNLNDILSMAEPEHVDKIHLFLEFAGLGKQDVPDPWHGDASDFESVFRLLSQASELATPKLLIRRK